MRHNRGYAAIAIITLALGIGAGTALFSVVNAVLLQSFGYADPARLVEIGGIDKQGKTTGVSLPDMAAVRERARSFERVATSTLQMFTIAGPREPENLYGQLVTVECFQALGATPLLGRTFAEGDFRSGAPEVAVLSYKVWQTTLGGDPAAVGRPIILNGRAHTLIGVMRPEFQYPHPVFRVWAPWKLTAENLANRLAHPYTILARLSPRATRKTAQAELDALSQSLAHEFPATNTGWHAVLAPVAERVLGNTRPTLLVLLGAVGFVLLIACMNVSNLLLARGLGRSRELAVRTALGATRWRIARLLAGESLQIAACGGALGLLFARWWLRALLLLLPDRTISILPGAERASLDGRVLALAVAVTLVCGIVFGLAPALRLSRTSPGDLLNQGGRGSTGSLGERRLLTGLIALEAALSVVLLAGAGLLIRSFSNLAAVQPGFRPDNVLTVQIPAPWEDVSRRPDEADLERRKQYLHDVVTRMQSIPGVSAAGIVTTLPLGPVNVQTRLFIEGRPAPGPGEDIRVLYRASNPDYFRAMGIPLLRGRLFNDTDRTGRPQVAIVNDAMARRYWPGEDAVGRRLSFAGTNGPWATVIGVAGDVRQNGLESAPVPEIYTSIVQTLLGPQVSTVVLRTAGDPAALGPTVRAAIRQLNPNQPIAELKTMNQLLVESTARPRLYTVLLAVFAALALLLAAAGIFSVISWTLSQSTREIAIRMALGATPRTVLASVMRRTLAGAAAGTLLGIAASVPLTRVLKAQLYGVTANDPATFVAVPVLLMAVAALAAWLPARRATGVDPVAELR